ncbi:TRAP transporter substrate-binding protein [Hahella sp. KA22]|uniref:TRAP transporter substrate-binding protein n=1 Tax=Hahella sp. KA22 TaxID=1628392 RepID=UPI001F4E3795|nr:TRAP transporter substrate-binding protein [Hahella sp. KA22]
MRSHAVMRLGDALLAARAHKQPKLTSKFLTLLAMSLAATTLFLATLLFTTLLFPAFSHAAEVTLRMHHFLPATSLDQEGWMEPWAEKIEKESEGRIKISIYPSMQLGGKPQQLFDQVRNGIVDIIWTLPGYTPSRFQMTSVFELPFVASSAEATSQAFHTFIEKYAPEEYQDVHVLSLHTHAAGSFHILGKPIEQIADLESLKIRAPTRASGEALRLLGANPLFMPAPEVPQAISKGVINAALLPFEVVPSLKLDELAESHTLLSGARGLYTATFILAMNKKKYDSLPEDLRAIIDRNSGIALSKQIGKAMDDFEKVGIELAKKNGNRFYSIKADQLKEWEKRVKPVREDWVAKVNSQNKNGEYLLRQAEDLVTQYEKSRQL